MLAMNSANKFSFVKERMENNVPECLGEFKAKKEQCKECEYVAQCMLERVESGIWNSAEQERKEK